MRLRYRDIKKIICLCAAMLFLVGVHVLSVYVFAVHRFTVSYDTALSEKAQDAVEDYIRLSRLYEVTSPEQVVQQLQTQFPFIRQVACAYNPLGLHLQVKVYRPFVQLPKGEAVTANNCRVPSDYFTQSRYAGLPMLHVTLAERERLPDDMFAYLASVEPSLLAGGVVRWRHNNEIVCELPGQPIRLICNYQKKPTREVLESCHVIAQDLKNQPTLAKGFCADVRFDGRIVVAKLRNVGA